MRLPRFRLRVRTLQWLVALVALGLVVHRVYDDGPEVHGMLLKLRFGRVAMRRSALKQAGEYGADLLIYDSLAAMNGRASSLPPPSTLATLRRRRQRGASLLFPAVIRATRERAVECRTNALRVLMHLYWLLRPDARRNDVVSLVLAATRDREDTVRVAALDVLPQLSNQHKDAVIGALRAALADPSVAVREKAIDGLETVGIFDPPAARSEAVSILIALVASRAETPMRVKGVKALNFIGLYHCTTLPVSGPDVVPALVAALRDPAVEVRHEAARSFHCPTEDGHGGRISLWDRRKDSIVPALKQALYDDDQGVRICSVMTLFHLKEDEVPSGYSISDPRAPETTETVAPAVPVSSR